VRRLIGLSLALWLGAMAFAAAAGPKAPFAADRAEIARLRASSNQAIAAHDMAAFLPVYAEDAVFVFSNGSSAVGRAGLAAVFAKDFADPAFVTYVRTPGTIKVSDTGVRAVEHGTWTALKREARGETRYSGDYAAHWFKTTEGWRIRGELFVKLRCAGPLCRLRGSGPVRENDYKYGHNLESQMSRYSVAEAKAGLTALINRALAGDEVIITRHGKVVAELRAPGSQGGPTPGEAAKTVSQAAFYAWLESRRSSPALSQGLTSVELLNRIYEDPPP
jgi:uncharacterized protein (TIGR02246 family)